MRNNRIFRFALLALCVFAAGCTTAGSSGRADGGSGNGGSGVTFFGDIDAGVSTVRTR